MSGGGPVDQTDRLKKALVAIKTLQARVEALELEKNEPIAVTGLACRFPGHANDPAAFWRLLRDGVDGISEVPKSRWDIDKYYDADPDAPGKTYARHGGFIDGIDEFDPHFFGISPREARSIDPQHRLMLEVAWEALEDARQFPAALQGTPTGVFVGITTSDYSDVLSAGGPQYLDAYQLTGCSLNFVAGRLAHVLGLQGPAMAIDTACSSSLVAVHLACQSLRAGECDLALAGGVNALIEPDMFISASKARMLSVDGRCKTFDARANGFVRGEGCGVVVLRRLSDARRRGDRILAIVRGSAVNQDGPSSGLTVPNKLAQEALIRRALATGKIDPAHIGYVEAHGTGTPLGDPIELRALASVLGEGRPAGQPFLLGSVKTNIGHLESAAGIAGFIKAVLTLVHEAVPPHLHLTTPTPHVTWSEIPARIPTQLTPWTRGDRPRLASVSSFGASGTNAYVVLEESPLVEASGSSSARPVHLLTLSARTPAALQSFAARFASHLASQSDSFADIAYTTNTRRSSFSERVAIVAMLADEATTALGAYAAAEESPAVVTRSADRPTPAKVAFLFTGQGSQYLGMGRSLYQVEPVFRGALDRCDAILRPLLDRPLLDVIFGNAEAGLIDRTDYTQPALFAIEWALAELWESWGVRPAAVLGHSVGEYAAACRAGLFSLEDGLTLIARRARLMADLPSGGDMAAIFAPESRVAPLISRAAGVSIAALNGPENTVVSGPSDAVGDVLRQCDSEGIRSRRLVVSHAFHSALLDPMLEQLEAAASRLRFHEANVAIVSNLTGRRASTEELSRGGYWRQHARMPVRFAEGVESLREFGCNVFVEIGPAPVLLGMAARCVPEGSGLWLPTLRQGSDDSVTICRTLAALWANDVPVDWARFHGESQRRAVFAPAGPFERQRLWIDPAPASRRRASATPSGTHPLLSAPIRTAATSDAIFESELTPSAIACLDGHRINGVAIVPATAYVDAMLSAARTQHGDSVNQLSDLTIREACAVPDDTVRLFQVIVGPMREGECTVRAFSAPLETDQSDLSWTLHASASARAATSRRQAASRLEDLRARVAAAVDITSHYERLADVGLTLGAPFRGITGLWRTSEEALARIEPAAVAPDAVLIDPAMLDACFQTTAPLVFDRTAGSMVVPTGVGRCRIDASVRGPLWSHAIVRSSTPEAAVLDVTVFTDDGQVAVEIEQLSLRRVRASAFGAREEASPFYRVEWEPRDSSAPRAAWSPTVGELSERLDDAVDVADPAFGVRAFDEHLPDLNRLATGYMLDALVKLGWRQQPGEIVTTDVLGDRLGVIPAHRRFLHRILSMLAEDGLLSAQGGGWRVEKAIGPSDVDRLEARLSSIANCAPELGMMTRVGRELAPALRGECDVVDLLFPQGSLAFAERLYEDSALFGPYNAAIKEAVVAAVARVPSGQRARILEIGAGTGATAARVLPHLPAVSSEYTFTDVSSLFLARAQEKFAAFPFVNYKLLDIERDPSAQGFSDGSFDVIVAANVLHATTDLRDTLRHARRLLAPGGLLVLLEGARALRLGDLIVGLTDGWWRFRDHDLRPAHALLAPDRWRTALSEVGFTESATWPAPSPEGGALSYHMVVVARTPDVDSSSIASSARPGAATWVVLADAAGFGARVAESLTNHQVPVVTVRASNGFAVVGPTEFEIDPSVPEQFVDLLRSLRADGNECAGIVHCWPLDVNRGADSATGLRLGTGSALHAVQALAREGAASSALWVVTRGAQAVAGIGRPVNALQASVWGLANTIAREYPELRCGRLDLDWPPTADEPELVARELLAQPEDDQIAYRGGGRYVARLVSAPAAGPAPDEDEERETPEQLFVESPGNIDGIAFREVARRAPGPGEIEVRVEAAGVNFRDVLRALGMYPGDTGDALGVECAGRIVSVGAGVRDRQVGERVIALADGAFGTFVTAPAPLVLRLPDAFSPSEGATIPSAFGTAWYGLITLARLRRGERVLIHAAAGGVGLAAVQVAQSVGAEVLATAGSARKRDLLRSMGVAHVFDSRSTSFVADLRKVAADGVDVVLNSLSGDFIPASVDVLRPAGRFVELGRRDILTDEQFRAARPAGAYYIVNLAETCRREPERAGTLLREVMAEFDAGRLRPLPITTFASDAVKEAFRHMAQARHVGKIIVTRPAPAWPFDPRASYLITGGLAGVGLLVADWMVDHGARHLVLMARSAPSAEALSTIASMEARGATVVVTRGDVAAIDDVRTALSVVPAGIPLRGVMHCAGVLDDGVVAQLNRDRLATVMAPKVAGSWNLHALTQTMPLDFFVLFSSAVSLLGSAGQGNHAAACAYQDALAWDRAANGVAACSINWGPWSDVGSVVRQKVGDRLKTKGLTPFGPREGLDLLETVLRHPVPQVAIIRADWTAYVGDAAGSRQAKIFERLTSRAGVQVSATSPESQEDLISTLRAAAPAEARRILDARVRQQLVKVLGLGAAFRLEPQHGLRDLGIDSLMSLELRNRLQAMVGRPLPSTIAFDYPTVEALTTFLAREILDVNEPGPARQNAADGKREAQVAEISALSQDEAEALLLAELSQIEQGRTR